jgi:hypothetical protein
MQLVMNPGKREDEAIVRTTIDLAHRLGSSAVALRRGPRRGRTRGQAYAWSGFL